METLADLFKPHKPAEIAEQVGVSTQFVDAWRTGKMPVWYTYIEPLAKFLGIDRQRVIGACIATGGAPVGP
jgi:transcriptional regulator with XRE-family HTH domain